MVESGTSSAFRGWVRARGSGFGFMGYGFTFGVRGRKVKSRDCALASDLVCLVPPGSTRKAKRRERRAEPSKI